MSFSAKCKEPNCTEQVYYTPYEVSGTFEFRTTFPQITPPKPESKRVYLTCANDHTHPYAIKGERLE